MSRASQFAAPATDASPQPFARPDPAPTTSSTTLMHSLDSERVIIATCLHDPHEALDSLLGMLAPEDFFVEHHGAIWSCTRMLNENGKSHDATALLDFARSRNLFLGGAEYIASLLDHPLARSATPESVLACAKRIKDYSTTRRVHALMRHGALQCESGGESSIEQIVGHLEDELANIRKLAESARSGPQHIGIVVDSVIERMDQQLAGAIEPALTTGYDELDEIMFGLSDEDLVILAARPSMGKTAFLNNLARNGAMAGRPSLIFSLEMKQQAMGLRMLAREARLDLSLLRRASLSGDDWSRLTEGAQALAGAPIWIDDTPGLTMREIRARSRAFVAAHGKCTIYVDYLQYISPDSGATTSAESTKSHVSSVSRGLKDLARELRVPVVALSQLNRGLEQRANKRPIMSDLRESGSIEQDADIILFLYRDEIYNPDTNDAGIAEGIVAKQRDGRIGTARLGFEGRTNHFYSLVNA